MNRSNLFYGEAINSKISNYNGSAENVLCQYGGKVKLYKRNSNGRYGLRNIENGFILRTSNMQYTYSRCGGLSMVNISNPPMDCGSCNMNQSNISASLIIEEAESEATSTGCCSCVFLCGALNGNIADDPYINIQLPANLNQIAYNVPFSCILPVCGGLPVNYQDEEEQTTLTFDPLKYVLTATVSVLTNSTVNFNLGIEWTDITLFNPSSMRQIAGTGNNVVSTLVLNSTVLEASSTFSATLRVVVSRIGTGTEVITGTIMTRQIVGTVL